MKKDNQYINTHESLLNDCRKGNRKSQFEIYKLYYKAMYNTSFRIVNNPADAEDIMQESFLKAFQNLEKFKGQVSFGAWLKRIVVNQSLDYLRKRKIEIVSLDDSPDLVSADETDDSWEVNEEPSYENVVKEINMLAEGYRVILCLYLIDGFSHSEIADMLNISSSTSRSQFNRAKKRLIERINNSRVNLDQNAD